MTLALHKTEKCFSFARIAQTKQRIDKKGSVSHPNITIIPILLAANSFRQRCRRRRDKGSGRRVREKLESHRASTDDALTRSAIVIKQIPFAPVRFRDREPAMNYFQIRSNWIFTVIQYRKVTLIRLGQKHTGQLAVFSSTGKLEKKRVVPHEYSTGSAEVFH